MPKKNGTTKAFSFDQTTLDQMKALMEYHKLTQTGLIEFLINREYREKIGDRR